MLSVKSSNGGGGIGGGTDAGSIPLILAADDDGFVSDDTVSEDDEDDDAFIALFDDVELSREARSIAEFRRIIIVLVCGNIKHFSPK